MSAKRTKPCDEALIAGRQRKAIQFLVAAVGKVGKQHGADLRVLLGLKTKASYSSMTVNAAQRKRAGRAAQRLVAATR